MEIINPTQKPYVKLSPFKGLCLTNFPFIDADFDALTDYELYAKVVEYLNKVIANEQIVSENVQALYDAFLSLQVGINEALAEQDAKIDDYFSSTNIQNYVDTRINEMIESNEFQQLLIEAINEINPNIIKFSNKVQTIFFDAPFYATAAPFNVIQAYLLDTTNKTLLINAIKETLIEQAENQYPTFYFINPNDPIVTYYIANITFVSDIASSVTIAPVFDFNYANIGANQAYTGYFTLNIVYTDDEITDLTFGSEYTLNYRQLNIGNTESFVPTLPYEPATKDYVDNNSGGGSSVPIYYYEIKRPGTVFSCSEYGGINFDGTDWDDFAAVLNQIHTDGYSSVILEVLQNSITELFSLNISSFDDTSSTTNITARQILNTQNYRNLLIYDNNNTGRNYTILQFTVSVSGGVITNFMYDYNYLTANSTFLPAEKLLPVNLSNSITLGTDVQATGSEGVIFIKEGNTYNLHGTITATTNTLWSNATITIPADHAPMPFEAGVAYTACYTTCILIKAADSSMQYLFSNYSHSADAAAGGFSFSPITAGTTFDSGDAIRFNITYIRKP